VGTAFGLAASLLDRHRAGLRRAPFGAFPAGAATGTLDDLGLSGFVARIVSRPTGGDRFGDSNFP
jgi:hypothetical protein